MSLAFMHALVARDLATAEAEIGAIVPANMPDTLDHFLQFRIADLSVDPEAQPWLGRAIVLTEADGTDRIIGSCGFHSPPESDGRVEVGYRVEPHVAAAGRRVGGRACPVRLGARAGRRPLPGVGRARQRPVAGDHQGSRLPPDRRPDRRHRRRGAHLRARRLATGDRRMTDRRARAAAFDTLAVHAGAEPDELTGAVSPPIYQTSTFAQDGVGRPRRGYEYARSQNPTRERLERAVAALEGGEHGIAFASGSAATAAIAELAAPGDEIVVGDDVYGGTFRYLERVRRGAGVDSHLRRSGGRTGRAVGGADRADAARLVRDAIEPAAQGHRHRRGRGDRRAASRGGRPAAARRGRQHLRVAGPPAPAPARARTSCSTRRRSTWPATPTRSSASPSRRTRPSRSGCGSCRTRWARVPGPLDCFLVLRGLRTLHLRMERHGANAAAVAAFLSDRARRRGGPLPGVRRDGVVHPGRRRRDTDGPRRNGPSRSPRGPACSRLPSRSAASNR